MLPFHYYYYYCYYYYTNKCTNTYYSYELYYYGVRYLEMANWGQHNGTSANLVFNNMIPYNIT